jgi:hypothetical protein
MTAIEIVELGVQRLKTRGTLDFDRWDLMAEIRTAGHQWGLETVSQGLQQHKYARGRGVDVTPLDRTGHGSGTVWHIAGMSGKRTKRISRRVIEESADRAVTEFVCRIEPSALNSPTVQAQVEVVKAMFVSGLTAVAEAVEATMRGKSGP